MRTADRTEHIPKPTALRLLLALAGLVVVPLTVAAVVYDLRDLDTYSESDQAGAVWIGLVVIVISGFVARWLILLANSPDTFTRTRPGAPRT